jgi:hypothetical protein
MDDRTQRRFAANEDRFRQVNEAISRGQWPGEKDAAIGFCCECATLGCNQLVELALPEYERVRAHPRRFVLVPGHQREEVEKVVETWPGYLVVEKTDAAGDRAERDDPRR